MGLPGFLEPGHSMRPKVPSGKAEGPRHRQHFHPGGARFTQRGGSGSSTRCPGQKVAPHRRMSRFTSMMGWFFHSVARGIRYTELGATRPRRWFQL